MKVKIGSKIYDPNIEPIMVILSDEDKENIRNMDSKYYKYCAAPDDLNGEEIENFMTTKTDDHPSMGLNYKKWWESLPKDFKDWVYGQGLNIRNKQHPTKLAYRCWRDHQEKIDQLKEDKKSILKVVEYIGFLINEQSHQPRQTPQQME